MVQESHSVNLSIAPSFINRDKICLHLCSILAESAYESLKQQHYDNAEKTLQKILNHCNKNNQEGLVN